MNSFTRITRHGILLGISMLLYSAVIFVVFQKWPLILFISMGLLFYAGVFLRSRLWAPGVLASSIFGAAFVLQVAASSALAFAFHLPVLDMLASSTLFHLSFWLPLGLGLAVGGMDRKLASPKP